MFEIYETFEQKVKEDGEYAQLDLSGWVFLKVM